MRYFFPFIMVMTLVEIAVLLFLGKIIGVWPTILLIVATGIIGAYLAKREGLQTIRKVQQQLRHGQIP
ncbi:FxsA family protein, partial [Alkalihalophilus pseudofirmus]